MSNSDLQLEPFLSNRSIEIMKNVILKKSSDAIKHLDDECDKILTTFQDCDDKYNAGCVYNFALFLSTLKYNTSVDIPSEESNLAKCISETFPSDTYQASFTQLYNEMNKKALSTDKPGWVFLTYNTKRKKLHICTLHMHDNPLNYCNEGPLRIPLFAWNIWEHAYFLQYEYRKNNYIRSLWYITNWSTVEKRFDMIIENTDSPLSISQLYTTS